MKKGILALLVLLAMIAGTAACAGRATPTEAEQPATPDSIQTFVQEVERLRKELNIPGLSVAVLDRQEVVLAMISTVLDLAKFDVAMDRNLIVSEESKEAMFTPTLSNSGQPLPYGRSGQVVGWSDGRMRLTT